MATQSMATQAEVLAKLQQAIDPRRVRTAGLEKDLYRKDASIYAGEQPLAICFPLDTQEVSAIVQICAEHQWPFVARGSGTGLAGGATPIGHPVMITTSKMNQVLSLDPETRIAWVQPGVMNLDLTNLASEHGLHYAPDPSSQQVCSIGGNVANNSGGPHCLAYGVTASHVVALKVVLPDGSVATLGDESPEPAGYDLRGVFVGSEGTLGVATEIAVRLTPNPPSVRTMLLVFDAVSGAAATVSGIIAAGLVPSAMEMLDALAIKVVEEYAHAGLPTDAQAVLLVELDGLTAGLDAAETIVRDVSAENSVREVRVARDASERDLFWKARKSAFGAVSRIAPDYYLHDTVVPRTRLVEVLEKVYEIVERHDLQVVNVLHAGDGNLHPLLSFDGRDEGMLERVHQAAEEIMQASLDAGGVLSGEHGIGVEKRDFMQRMFSDADLQAQDLLRGCFDPMMLSNPDKVIPSGSRCGDFALAMRNAGRELPEEVWV